MLPCFVFVLRDIDAELSKMDVLYCRYSDDLLMIGKDAIKAKETLEIMLKDYGKAIYKKIQSEHSGDVIGDLF